MQTPHERANQHAEDCILYYESFLNDSGQNMALGRFMAKQWKRLLSQEHPDLEEVRLFSLVLNKESGWGSCGGSQWHSMSIEVRYWLESSERPTTEVNHATS